MKISTAPGQSLKEMGIHYPLTWLDQKQVLALKGQIKLNKSRYFTKTFRAEILSQEKNIF